MLRALRAAHSGHPGTVIVSGEAGIGKTRLVEELVDGALTEGFQVALGNCSPVRGTRLPYGPVVDLVSDLIRQSPDLAKLVTAEAWRSVGVLAGVDDELPIGRALEVASARLFAGFVELLAVASRRQPALIVVEDVHWADPASTDLVLFAARKFQHDRILLVLTHRPAGAPPRSAVRSALAEIRRLPRTTDISVGPLPDSAIATLIDELPAAPPQPLRDRITAACDGIPFFALHWALHGKGRAVPPGLRDVLLCALDDLSSNERELLVMLTVSDHAAEGTMPPRFNHLVRGLVDRGILIDRDGSISFRHALLREVVADDALPSERIVAHSRVADALLASAAAHQPGRAGEIAHHLLGCGRHLDAMRFAMRGARHAGSVWAFADARSLFETVRRLWPLVDGPEAATGITYPALLRVEAMASRWCGQLDEALHLLREALDVVGLPPALRVEIEHARGQVLWAAGDMAGSLGAYESAESELPATTDDELRCAVLASLAQGLMVTGNAQRAERTAYAAIELASATGADRERINATITLAAVRAQLGQVDAAVADLRRCLPECRGLDDLELVVRCYGNLTFALGIACRYEELAATAAEGTAICRRYGPVVSLASNMMNNHVEALIALGRWDEAVVVADKALEDTTASGVAMYLRTRLAEVALARGDVVEADCQLAQIQELGAGNPYALSPLSVVRAERALNAHDPHAAAAIIAEVLPTLQAQDDTLPLLAACWLGLRAAADIAEAVVPRRRGGATAGTDLELLVVARGAYDRTDLPAAAALFLACQAEAARISGSDTAGQWAAAADANSEFQRPYARAYCSFRLGAAQLRRQARTAAAEALGEGLRLAAKLGARPLIAEIETLGAVSDLRLTTPSPPPAGSDPPEVDDHGLTRRERQVLALLTTGATNRMVARTLFISERTASVHVHHILTKLGAANRTEAARIALRLNLDTGPS